MKIMTKADLIKFLEPFDDDIKIGMPIQTPSFEFRFKHGVDIEYKNLIYTTMNHVGWKDVKHSKPDDESFLIIS